MLNLGGKRIYLACGATDMRNHIDGLASIVQNSFKLTPASDAIFVFCNANRNRLKILEWDGDGGPAKAGPRENVHRIFY